MPYISHIRDNGRSSFIMTPISLGNLLKSVQLYPHIRTPLSSESCSGRNKKGTHTWLILSMVLICFIQENYFINFRHVLKFIVTSQVWIWLLLIELASSWPGIHQISYIWKIWPYELSLLIISISGLRTFSSPCIRACYRRNSSVRLNSYSLGIVRLGDLQQ